MKLNFKILIIILTMIILVACSKEKSNSIVNYKGDSAQNVVENYFEFNNEKNKDKVLTTLTEEWNTPNIVWGFENLDSIKIINIEEEKDGQIVESYLNNGRGSVNGATKNNLKIYKVKYEVNYKKDGVGPQDSGIYNYWYYLVRKDEKSPWLIDDMGV
ncbi:DUF4829 domain-containing protein [Clostridium ihumii]|uniref:DUF4829 domain-containing protein n=1 Tax=Clostridium ihumii TaxID=1470356 RepID=UPI00054D1B23|nr:DUF4829 domain-containing protein [Clostridium ihumii]